jgi:hypothetical protein
MSSRKKAIIELEVPEWQIGQEASIYFKDTMYVRAMCREADEYEEKIEKNRQKYSIMIALNTSSSVANLILLLARIKK